MPPKSKLHKATGKLKSLPTSSRTENNENQPILPQEAAQQLELELCWCIQQLQTALKSGKLSPKQVQENTKVLNTLMNNSAPLIKKRQVMRLSFGDYRAKMALEDKKLRTASYKIKVSQGEPSKKSMFIKKSAFTSSNNGFRFNFPSLEQNIVDDLSSVRIENDCENIKRTDSESGANIENIGVNTNFQFLPSTNGFRFNFE